MKKKFRFDPARQEEIRLALEGLKNETLKAISAEMISGGASQKLMGFSQITEGWVKDSYILS